MCSGLLLGFNVYFPMTMTLSIFSRAYLTYTYFLLWVMFKSSSISAKNTAEILVELHCINKAKWEN